MDKVTKKSINNPNSINEDLKTVNDLVTNKESETEKTTVSEIISNNENDITTAVKSKDLDVITDDIFEVELSDKKIKDFVTDQKTLETIDVILTDQTKIEVGLTTQEATELLKVHGQNKLEEKKKQSKFMIFFKQLKDLMILLLFIAMVCSFAVAIVSGINTIWDFSNSHLIISFVEPFIILIVIILYCILGGIQELKSQEAVSSLKKMSTTLVTVKRDGMVKKIDSLDVVPGDLMLIEAGDKICADAILLNTNGLECVESALTGESLPIKKNANAKVNESAPLGDQINKIFSGCIVTNGQGVAKVIATGSRTQVGRIATLIDSQKAFLTPLQFKLKKLGKVFGYAGLGLFILTFLIQIFILNINNVHITWMVALTTSISLAVAAIPEGLGAFTTIILSIGLKKMATKHNGLIKRVSSVETLGSTSVICTDKTGTLTINKMTLTDLWIPNEKTNYLTKNNKLHKTYYKLVESFLLCTNSFLEKKADNKIVEIGDPTELSVINFAEQVGINKETLLLQHMRIHCNPFDSTRKLMSTINFIDGKQIAIVKGAPDVLVARCKNKKWEDISFKISEWSNKGYRVIAVAAKELQVKNKYDEEFVEKNLTFIGLVAMYDPPRIETKDAISRCIAAGIKPVMITGDHLETAVAIAKEVGIFKDGDKALSGTELKAMDEAYLAQHVVEYSVYARVSPEDKLKIVKAWQANDQVVAMTGDGVNDAPALKAADIGCAMGITGTDVAKEAADMILMDDNFNTIVVSVANGRRVYQTIKRVIQNVLLSSIAEIIVMLLGIIIFRYAYSDILGDDLDLHIFSATQLLVINLVTDGFPAIALGIQGTSDNLMKRRPYSKYESIFARRMGINLILQGLLFGFLSLVAFAIGIEFVQHNWFNNNMLVTLNEKGLNAFYAGSATAFMTLGWGVSIHALNLMSNKSLFNTKIKDCWIVYSAVSTSLSIIMLISFVPDVALVFGMPHTLIVNGAWLILFALIFALIPVIFMESYKFMYKIIEKEVLSMATITSFELIRRPIKRKRFKLFKKTV